MKVIIIVAVISVLQRNPQAPDNEPGFPLWSIPASMNCNCPPPCSYISYTTEIQNEIRYSYTNLKIYSM